jgi:hypothetical protein
MTTRVGLPIADCRLKIHGLPIGHCRFALAIADLDWPLPIWIGDWDWRLPIKASSPPQPSASIDCWQSNRQSAIQSAVANRRFVNRQSAVANLQSNLQSLIDNP